MGLVGDTDKHQNKKQNLYNARDFIAKEEWKFFDSKTGNRAEFKIIKDKILYSHFSGSMKYYAAEAVLKILDNIFAQQLLSNDYIKIADYSEVSAGSFRAKRIYAEGLNQLHEKYNLRPSVTYIIGANRLMRITINLFKSFVKQNFVFVNSQKEAFYAINHNSDKKYNNVQEENRKLNISVKDLNNLIQYIGSIVWNEKNAPRLKQEHQGPLDVVYDALGIIKKDISFILKESDDSEIAIKEANLAVLETNRYLMDVTDQLEDAKLLAEESNRLKSSFLANMSHEIRTPLNAILGYTKLLKRTAKNEQEIEYLDIIKKSGENLLMLINDILDLSKIEAGKLEIKPSAVNVSDIVEDIFDIFRNKARENQLELLKEIDNSIPKYLLLDEIRLRQILFNLVGNAIKFTHSGYVKIKLKTRKKDVLNNNIDLAITVIDTGIGISKDHLERIFEAFIQQKNQDSKYSGTGLGLAITKNLVEMMNGEISVKSEINIGSEFTVLLKSIQLSYIPQKIDDVDKNKTFDNNISFKGSKVLIAEDNLFNQKLLTSLLKEKQIKTVVVNNGEEAIKKIKNQKFDLIILDLKMPVMNGFEAARIIKQNNKYSEIPLFAITAGASLLNEEDENYFETKIYKPIDEDNLYFWLAKYLPKRYIADSHKKKNIDEVKDEIKDDIPPDKIDELLSILSNLNQKKWIIYKKAMLLNNWEAFAQEILSLGEKFNSITLLNYSKNMLTSLQTYNVAQLKSLIDSFPDIYIKLKEIKNNKE